MDNRLRLRFCRRSRTITFLLTALVLGQASFAAAQSPPIVPAGGIAAPARPERPYRGLFGGGVGNTAQKLTAEASVGSGINQTNSASQSIGRPEGVEVPTGGLATNVSGKVEYFMTRGKYGVDASGNSSADYDPLLSAMVPRHTAIGMFHFAPLKSTSMSLIGTFKNVPEFSFAELFGEHAHEVVPLNQTFGVTVDRYTRYGSQIEASQRLGRRTKFDFSYAWGRGIVETGLNWTIISSTATVSQQISKGLGAHFGYLFAQQTTQTPDGKTGTERNPNLTFGVDFGRPLSLTRRMTLFVSTGITQARLIESEGRSNFFVGSVGIAREFGRTWSASGSYGRSLQFVESLATPLLSETLSGGVNGSFSERLQFGGSFGASKGQFGTVPPGVAVVRSGSRYDSYFGSVRTSFAANRYIALGADYTYTDYRGLRPVTGEQRIYPHTMRAYLQLWAPLMVRTKR